MTFEKVCKVSFDLWATSNITPIEKQIYKKVTSKKGPIIF